MAVHPGPDIPEQICNAINGERVNGRFDGRQVKTRESVQHSEFVVLFSQMGGSKTAFLKEKLNRRK